MIAMSTTAPIAIHSSVLMGPPDVPEPLPLPPELDVTETVTGADVRSIPLESVTVTVTLQEPVVVGTHESWEVSDDEQPDGTPFHEYE